jgi:DNA-binding transcriptional regulator/RsmH inhibitor MraZ
MSSARLTGHLQSLKYRLAFPQSHRKPLEHPIQRREALVVSVKRIILQMGLNEWMLIGKRLIEDLPVSKTQMRRGAQLLVIQNKKTTVLLMMRVHKMSMYS